MSSYKELVSKDLVRRVRKTSCMSGDMIVITCLSYCCIIQLSTSVWGEPAWSFKIQRIQIGSDWVVSSLCSAPLSAQYYLFCSPDWAPSEQFYSVTTNNKPSLKQSRAIRWLLPLPSSAVIGTIGQWGVRPGRLFSSSRYGRRYHFINFFTEKNWKSREELWHRLQLRI